MNEIIGRNINQEGLDTNLSLIGEVVPNPTTFWGHLGNTFYEGSWLMGTIESNIGGMHYMSLFHDGWGENAILGLPAINQVTIIPAIGLNYCVLAGGACAGVITPSPPKTSKSLDVSNNQINLFDKK